MEVDRQIYSIIFRLTFYFDANIDYTCNFLGNKENCFSEYVKKLTNCKLNIKIYICIAKFH